MKKMFIKTSMVMILALNGCGSDSNESSSKTGQSVDTVLKISEAVQKTPSSMDNGFKSNTFSSAKMMQKINAKSDGTFNCSPERTDETDNGTKKIETLEDGIVKITYNECFEDDTMSDGVLEYYEDDKGTIVMSFTEYMYVYFDKKVKADFYRSLLVAQNQNNYLLNGDISSAKYENDKFTILEEYDYDNLMYLEQDNYTIYINGTESMKVGSCTTAVSFKYEMEEGTWLTFNSQDDTLIDSGKITINGKKYTYSDDGKVFVSYNEKSNTFEQKELLAEEEKKKYAESCSTETQTLSSKMFNGKPNYELNIEKLLKRY